MDRSAQRRILAFMAVGHAFSHAFLLFYPLIVVALEKVFPMTYGELMMLALASALFYGLGALPAGWLGDKWSARGMLVLMFLLMGIGAIVVGLAQSAVGIVAGLALIGLGGSIYHPVGIAIVVRYAENRGKALGVNGIFGGVGMAAAYLTAGALTEWLGWRWAFIIPGLLSFAAGALFLAYVPQIARAGERVLPHSRAGISGFRAILPVFSILVAASICTGLIYQSASMSMPRLMADRIDFLDGTILGIGGMVTALYLIGAAGQYFGGHAADKYSLKALLILVFAVQVPAALLVAVGSGWPLLIVAQIIVLFNLGVQPISDSLLAHYVPEEWHARAYGVRFVASLGVSALSIPILATIHDQTGDFYWLYVLLAGLAAFALALVAFLPRERSIVQQAGALGS